MRSLCGLVALGAFCLASVSTATAAETRRSLQYLYIEANEGGSSGGHVALALGDEVFHFQHRPPGVLVLVVDDLERFRYRYGVLENRAIHVSRIPVSEETYRLLVDHFRGLSFLQSRHLDVMEELSKDRSTLEQMLAGVVDVEAAGLFAVASAASGSPSDPVLADLRARVRAVHGDDVLERLAAEARERLATLDPGVMELPELPAAGLPPAPSYSFPRRYRDAVTTLAAIDVLRGAPSLEPGARLGDDAGLPMLTEPETEAARRLSESLREALVRLVASERPDSGVALLVGMARLVALAESQRHGRWVVVDVFPTAATSAGPARARLDAGGEMGDARRALDVRREQLVARAAQGHFPEAEFTAFEGAANRLGELRLARAERRERRVPATPPIASRPARRSVTGLDRGALRRGLEAVREREAAYAAAFERRWGYNLFTRNCASEIFVEIDAAFAGDAEESRARLGGRVDMEGSLNFIPVVSASTVADAYPVVERIELPSYRQWRKERMYARENPVAVFLRESNTITSAIYRRNADDSIFVFFTDDAAVLRPLLGAVNLVVGLAASGVGLVTLPVDGGATLWAGLRGAVFSLPELFFQNIRKGSFPHIEAGAPTPLGSRQPEAPGGR